MQGRFCRIKRMRCPLDPVGGSDWLVWILWSWNLLLRTGAVSGALLEGGLSRGVGWGAAFAVRLREAFLVSPGVNAVRNTKSSLWIMHNTDSAYPHLLYCWSFSPITNDSYFFKASKAVSFPISDPDLISYRTFYISSFHEILLRIRCLIFYKITWA